MNAPIEIITLDEDGLQTYGAALVALLCDAVDSGASISFLAPLALADAEAYWARVARAVRAEGRVVLVALVAGQVAGSVQLVPATVPNGPHRAEVQKLMVHTRYRRQGIAKRLMLALEAESLQRRRTLLYLDTRRGDAAELLYRQLGYVFVGIIPRAALSSAGTYDDTVYFYKDLLPS